MSRNVSSGILPPILLLMINFIIWLRGTWSVYKIVLGSWVVILVKCNLSISYLLYIENIAIGKGLMIRPKRTNLDQMHLMLVFTFRIARQLVHLVIDEDSLSNKKYCFKHALLFGHLYIHPRKFKGKILELKPSINFSWKLSEI